MSPDSLKKSRLGSLPSGGRKSVSASQEQWVSAEPLHNGQAIPLMLRPQLDGLDLIAWSGVNRDYINQLLYQHGALLFRGFGVSSASTFEQFIKVTAGELFGYHERSSPRTEVGNHIYTSTDYPSEYPIFLHNEHSYARDVPLKIYFYCDTAPRQGGETPIADCRKVLARIPAAIRERFRTHGWRYVRNFGLGLGLSWETSFQTNDRSEVERYCAENGINCSWLGENRLRTVQNRPALATHPYSREKVWFNHATFFHVSTLPELVRESLLAEFAESELPNNTYYGDGTSIEAEVLETLRDAYLQEKRMFPWERGDILILDNMLVAHARESFQGPRKILVGMADMYSWLEDFNL